MKNHTISTATVFFSFLQHLTSRLTAKVKPKYEYAFLKLSYEMDVSGDYHFIYAVDYADGKHEKLLDEKWPLFSSKVYEYHSKLFKAFDYLGTMKYELVSSVGKWDISDGMQCIFRRERK